MGFLDLLIVAMMPVLKVLLITGVGLFLAMDRIDLLGKEARHHLNNIVFYVFSPSLVVSTLAETITFESLVTLWFMPVNILITFIIGSALARLLIKITKTPKHLQGMVIGCCSAGNLGNLFLIMIPAVCNESNNPFGDSSVCSTNAQAYASLSTAIGAIFIWSYVYAIMFEYANKSRENNSTITIISYGETETFSESSREALLPLRDFHRSEDYSGQDQLPCTIPGESKKVYPGSINTHLEICLRLFNFGIILWIFSCVVTIASNVHSICNSTPVVWSEMMSVLKNIIQHIKIIIGKIDLKKVFAPTAIAAIVGFIIGTVSPIREVIIGDSAPLHVIDTSVYLLGEAAIPCMTLVLGANLLTGLKRSDVSLVVITGIIAVRNVLLPLLGIGVVKVASRFGMVGSDSLYQFVLMLQYASPPAMAVGTMTQLFQQGQVESSVIMLWTYAVASFSLTLWSTLFMWLLA